MGRSPCTAGVCEDNFDKAPFLSNALDDQEAAASQAALWCNDTPDADYYFLEPIPGEYELINGSYLGDVQDAPRQARVADGQPVPRSGWWYSPARAGSSRYFKEGATFPEFADSDWGSTFWLRADDQSAPRLRWKQRAASGATG